MNREMLLPLLQAELNRALGEIESLRAEIERLRALVIEASEWSAYPHDDSEYGFRHCCGTEDFKPHTDECRFAIRAQT
jgi:hypothetical protein